jgi:hypothetical protein
MQLMSWTIARFGSRFQLLFEPYHRRVRHGALGQFLDQPLDLKVGLVEPDGTERVLPFTAEANGRDLLNCEQFERINSITFRGYSETYRLQFEFNIHSPFYPQDERLCIMPALYLEMRVNPIHQVRWHEMAEQPRNVKLFIRLQRPETDIHITDGEGDPAPPRLAMRYQTPLEPTDGHPQHEQPQPTTELPAQVTAEERLVSLNPEAEALATGDGLTCELPVTPSESGIKWRLVWASHVSEPVLSVRRDGQDLLAPFAYTEHWSDVEQVLAEALETRDDRLAFSRRFEKILEQVPIDMAGRHLLNQGFQSWLANTWRCMLPDRTDADGRPEPFFSVWEGSALFHSTLDVEYNNALLYLAIWPDLLAKQLRQWAEHFQPHAESGGGYAPHDIGRGLTVTGPAYPRPMELEESANYLLLMQAYAHWTADRDLVRELPERVAQLTRYLIWCDRDGTGFPEAGTGNPFDEAAPATQFSHKQTHLAVKRVAGLRAASELLEMVQQTELAEQAQATAEADLPKIEQQAWLGDHYAICVEHTEGPGPDVLVSAPVPAEYTADWDAYSIHTAGSLLLPTIVGQPPLLDEDRLRTDLAAGIRENFGRYGCGHTSVDTSDILISQNIWRDLLAEYLKGAGLSPQCYWDLQLLCNTHQQSMGYVDTYINDWLAFYPRGVTAFGYMLAGPRLQIDRLAAGGVYITVDPDRHLPQRWPLLPLADWTVGKIPVCVVDSKGEVTIEGQNDPIIVHGNQPADTATGKQVIG